jgi:hypothetical protein
MVRGCFKVIFKNTDHLNAIFGEKQYTVSWFSANLGYVTVSELPLLSSECMVAMSGRSDLAGYAIPPTPTALSPPQDAFFRSTCFRCKRRLRSLANDSGTVFV